MPRGVERRSDAEGETIEDGNQQCEREDRAIGPGGGEARDALGRQRGQHAPGEARQGESGQSAEYTEHGAFRQGVADDVAAAGPQSQPHGHFAMSSHGARQQEIGHVGATDEQEDRSRRHQKEETGRGATERAVAQRVDGQPPPGVAGGPGAFEAVADRRQILPRLGQRDAGTKPGHRAEAEVVAILLRGVHRKGRPEIHVRGGRADAGGHAHGEIEIRRHDPDDGAGVPVDLELAAHHGTVRLETAHPQSVTEDHDAGTGPVFLGADVAAEHGGDAQGRKQVGGDGESVERLRQGAGIAREVEERVVKCGYGGKGACVPGKILHVEPGYPIGVGGIGVGEIGAELYQLAGAGVRQGLQQHGADGSEDHGGGAHAERDGENGDGRGAGRAQQQTKRNRHEGSIDGEAAVGVARMKLVKRVKKGIQTDDKYSI